MRVPPCGASVWGFRIQGWLAGIANTSAGTATWCCSKEPNLWVHLGSNLNSVSSSVICAYNVCYITLPTKVCIVKAMVFPVVVYGCESWSIKEAEHWKTDPFKLWCWRRFLRVPWVATEIQPVSPKGNQSWMFIGRTNVEVETPILWPPVEKSWLIRKDPDAEKDWRWEKKMITEDEIVGWHHQLNGLEFG